jgi:hypothetical protein
MLNFLRPCIGPAKAEKRIAWNLGGQFAALGANLQPKNAQSWPQVFLFSPDY